MSHGAPSDIATAQTPESSADAIATGLFDHPPAVDIGYFGKSRVVPAGPGCVGTNTDDPRRELESRLLLVPLCQHRER